MTKEQKRIEAGNVKLLELADYVERRQRRKPAEGYDQKRFRHRASAGGCGSPSCMVGHGAVIHGGFAVRGKNLTRRNGLAYWDFIDESPGVEGNSTDVYALNAAEWDELFRGSGCDDAGQDWQKAVAYVRAFVQRRRDARARKLKLWNGRWRRGEHAFIAAYSQQDARALCKELAGFDPGMTEVTQYWSAGCWGNSMDGITPERGIWVQADSEPGRPIRRLTPKVPQ